MSDRQKKKTKRGSIDAIRARLRWWYDKRGRESPQRYGNYDRAATTLGLNRPTLRGWLVPGPKGKKPPLPNLSALVELIEKEGLSPTWLLLGQGPEFLDSDVRLTELGEHLRAFVVEDIARRWSVERELAEKVVPPPTELLAFTRRQFRKRVRGFMFMYRGSAPEGQGRLLKVLEEVGPNFAEWDPRPAMLSLMEGPRHRSGVPDSACADVIENSSPAPP